MAPSYKINDGGCALLKAHSLPGAQSPPARCKAMNHYFLGLRRPDRRPWNWLLVCNFLFRNVPKEIILVPGRLRAEGEEDIKTRHVSSFPRRTSCFILINKERDLGWDRQPTRRSRGSEPLVTVTSPEMRSPLSVQASSDRFSSKVTIIIIILDLFCSILLWCLYFECTTV